MVQSADRSSSAQEVAAELGGLTPPPDESPTDAEKYAALYEEAITLARVQRDYDTALRHLDRLLEMKPSSSVYQFRALIKLIHLDWQGALEDCDQAIETDPACGEAYHARAYIRSRSPFAEDLERAYPDRLKAALYDQRTGYKVNKAVARADRACAVRTRVGERLRCDVELAFCATVAHWERYGLDVRPRSVHLNGAIGELQEAIRCYEEDLGMTCLDLAMMQVVAGDWSDASATLERARELVPTRESVKMLSVGLALARGNLSEAEGICDPWVKVEEGDSVTSDAWTWRGYLQLARDEPAFAALSFYEASREDPTQWAAYLGSLIVARQAENKKQSDNVMQLMEARNVPVGILRIAREFAL